MLWGDPSSFAIEAEATASQGPWRLGRLRLFVGGAPAGDLDDTVDLASSARWGRTFLAASSRRTRPDLDGLGPEDTYRALYGRHFEPGAPPAAIDRDPYLLDDVGDASLRDRATVIAVRGQDLSDTVLVRDHATGETRATTVRPGLLDETIRAFCEWCESL